MPGLVEKIVETPDGVSYGCSKNFPLGSTADNRSISKQL